MKQYLWACCLVASAAYADYHCAACAVAEAAAATSDAQDTVCVKSDTLCEIFHDDASRQYGVKDKDGKIVVPAIYDQILVDDDDTILAITKQTLLLDKKGNQLASHLYIAPITQDRKLFYTATDKGGRYGILNSQGKVVVPAIYSDVKVEDETVIVANDAGKWALMDAATGKLKTEFLYDQIGYFQEDLAPIAKDDKYGFINHEGKEVIRPIYDDIQPFDLGLAVVQLGEERFYIDKTGKRIR